MLKRIFNDAFPFCGTKRVWHTYLVVAMNLGLVYSISMTVGIIVLRLIFGPLP